MASGGGPKLEFVSSETYYGKHCVRLLQHQRSGNRHGIKQFKVDTNLTLARHKDYLHGDNADVIATDSQKNTIFAVAKAKGVTTPEQFAMDLSQHFLDTYSQIARVEIIVDVAPWRRMNHTGQEHVHAFIETQEVIRFCVVQQERQGRPQVWAGLRDMKIMKTTQAGFVGFVRDRYTSLPEVTDRIVCTSVTGKWSYSNVAGMDFDKSWETCKNTILDVFAGPPDTGKYSPSVQQTAYFAAEKMMKKVPQIDQVELEMPNIHYVPADLKKIGVENDGEIMVPTGDPFGYIKAAVRRRPNARL